MKCFTLHDDCVFSDVSNSVLHVPTNAVDKYFSKCHWVNKTFQVYIAVVVKMVFYLLGLYMWDTAGLRNDSRSKAHMFLFIFVCHTVVMRGCVMRCASNCLARLVVCT